LTPLHQIAIRPYLEVSWSSGVWWYAREKEWHGAGKPAFGGLFSWWGAVGKEKTYISRPDAMPLPGIGRRDQKFGTDL